MQCPKCGTYEHRVNSASAVDSAQDGTVHRIRRCKCGHSWRTREIPSTDLHALEHGATPRTPPPPPIAWPTPTGTRPLALALGVPLVDIEHEMESLLPAAIAAMRESLADKEPSKARVDVAKYVVEDRRQHRRALAEAAQRTGQTPADPAVAQLAALLASMPPGAES